MNSWRPCDEEIQRQDNHADSERPRERAHLQRHSKRLRDDDGVRAVQIAFSH